MKSQNNSKRINMSNIEIKRNAEERLKKRMKERIKVSKETINNKERFNKQSNIMEKKINYERKSIRVDKSMDGNNIIKNKRFNNRHINNLEYVKKEKYRKDNNMNRTTYNNEKNNLIIKKTISDQIGIYKTNRIQNNNKYINKTLDIEEKEDNINRANNFNCAINNNILYLINSNNDNIIGNFDIENLNEKGIINRTNSSSKIYSSSNKEINIINYDKLNNDVILGKGIYTNNNYKNRNKKNYIIKKDNNNNNFSNYIYKKTVRNNSCLKRESFYNNKCLEAKNENKENKLSQNLNLSIHPYYQRKDRSLSINIDQKRNNIEDKENFILSINEDYNNKINNKKIYLYQIGTDDNKSYINKINNGNKTIYNKIRTKRMIKSSLRKKRFTNNLIFKESLNNDFTDINDGDKNNKTMILNRKKDCNNLKEFKNQCKVYLNDNLNDINNNFNRTSVYLYKNKKLDNIPKNMKETKIGKRQKYFYKDGKALEIFKENKNKDKDSNNKINDINIVSPPILLHMNSPVYINKMNNIPKSNNRIYYKKNINDKKIDFNSLNTKSFKIERSNNFSTNYDNNTSNNDKIINDENIINDSNFDSSLFENINETINNYHCFQKKLYNYCIKKLVIKPYYIEKIKFKRNIKEKLFNNNSFNLQNISEIENKTSSLKNISKEYPNFELSEIDEKKNSIEKDKIEIKDKKYELSSIQKISLGTKKLNDIFIKKNESENRKSMPEDNYSLGNFKLNDIIFHKMNQNESTKEESNNNIIINKKIYTYKIHSKNKLELEDENEKEENNKDSLKKKEKTKKEKNNNKKLILNNTNNNFYAKINEINNSERTNLNERKIKQKRKPKSSEKRKLIKLIDKEIKKENEIEDNVKTIVLKDLENYLKYLEKEKINYKEDFYDGMNDSYDWKIIDELINEKNIKINDIIRIYIDICKQNKFINQDIIFKENEYIKSIIEYYTNNLSKNQKEIIHLNMIEIFNDIDNILNNTNENMYEILGYLFFILLKNKLYYMKDLNCFIEKEKSTQINIAKIVKYAILSSGNLSKQYHNDFKYTKLFNNNDIFVNYITKEIYKKESK